MGLGFYKKYSFIMCDVFQVLSKLKWAKIFYAFIQMQIYDMLIHENYVEWLIKTKVEKSMGD